LWWCKQLCWDLPTLLLLKLLHEREQTLCLDLQSLHPIPLSHLSLPLGQLSRPLSFPLSKQGLLPLPKMLHLGLQHLTPMFQ
jgi:hypothetical protein